MARTLLNSLEDLDGLDLVGGEIARLGVAHVERAHRLPPETHRHGEAGAQTDLEQEVVLRSRAALDVPAGRRALRREHFPRQSARAIHADGVEGICGEPHARRESEAARPTRHADGRDPRLGQPAGDLARARENGLHVLAHEHMAEEDLELAEPADVASRGLNGIALAQGVADPVGDHEEQQDLGLGKGRPRRAAARVENSQRAASRADRDGDGIGDGKQGEERILHDAGGAAGDAREPLVLEGLAHESFPRLDGDGLEVVPAEPATGTRHEPRGEGVPGEEHGTVGGEDTRHAIHGEGEDLRRLEAARGDGQDLLAHREGIPLLRRLRGDPGPERRGGKRGTTEPVGERLDAPSDLDERTVKVRRGRIRGDLLVAHGQSDQILLRPRTHPPGKLRRPLAPRYLAARERM